MRIVTVILFVVLVLLQFKLWLGEGGYTGRGVEAASARERAERGGGAEVAGRRGIREA